MQDMPALYSLPDNFDFHNQLKTNLCVCVVQRAMPHQDGAAPEARPGIPEMPLGMLLEMLGTLPEMVLPVALALLLGNSVMTRMLPEGMAQHP